MKEIKIGDKALVEMNVVGWDKITGDYQMRHKEDTRTFWASKEIVHPMAAKTYEDGMREAWELAKKIICNIEYGGLHTSELEQIFGYTEFDDVLKNYTPQEAAAKIAEWDGKQKIHVGDLVCVAGAGYGVVTSVHKENCYVLWTDGSCGCRDKKSLTKTDRAIDIKALLEQIGGTE